MALSSWTAGRLRLRLLLTLTVCLCPYQQYALAWTVGEYRRQRRTTTARRRHHDLHSLQPHDEPRDSSSRFRYMPRIPAMSVHDDSSDEDEYYDEDPNEDLDAPPPATSNRISRTISVDGGIQQARIISRRVDITPTNFSITVWEWEKPAAVVETYWQVQQQGLALTKSSSRRRQRVNNTTNVTSNNNHHHQQMLDPFGLVTWPGSIIAIRELLLQQNELLPPSHVSLVRHKTVLVLGAGVGVEAQAVALLGARHVIATDIHPTTLQLLAYGAEQAGDHVSAKITTQVLDLYNHRHQPLPDCDLMIVADVLYNDQLAEQVIQRCIEARRNQIRPPPVILISDSQRFVHSFESQLNERLCRDIPGHGRVAWMSRRLQQFTGSGVCIDADQTYDVKARVMWIGLMEQQRQQETKQLPMPNATAGANAEDYHSEIWPFFDGAFVAAAVSDTAASSTAAASSMTCLSEKWGHPNWTVSSLNLARIRCISLRTLRESACGCSESSSSSEAAPRRSRSCSRKT